MPRKRHNNHVVLFETKDLELIFGPARDGVARMDLATYDVSLRRMQCFAVKGAQCVACDTIGTEIRLEKWPNGGGIHLDLFGPNKNGDMILMTIDHIIPKSKGGPNSLDNYQPMCYRCNQKKGNNYIHVPQSNLLQ